MDPTAKQSIIDRLGQANNVLVTVKSSPSVDSLSACIGFTLFLNKLGKHATAVFSGDVPSTLEFLKPEETLEKNTDSLRDFIIALDKSKADKLRYKVEDEIVKIFITPYRTSLSEKDLDFSQGDFNVDAVVAIGVHAKEDLDKAIVTHGRILHDATVISINNGPGGALGTLHLEDPQASSLCEMLVSIAEGMHPGSFDAQMATAFLTGIVAETDRFSNKKTTPQTMNLSAKLMTAGANQQLIATQLQPDAVASGKLSQEPVTETDAGTLTIEHEDGDDEAESTDSSKTETVVELPEIDTNATDTTPSEPSIPPITQVRSQTMAADQAPAQAPAMPNPSRFAAPPSMGGTLTANTQPQHYDPATDPLSLKDTASQPTLQHNSATLDAPTRQELEDQTLTDIEKTVQSDHVADTLAPEEKESNENEPRIESARQAVEEATEAVEESRPLAQERTGASFLDENVQAAPPAQVQASEPTMPTPTAPAPLDLPQPAQTPLPSENTLPAFMADKGMPPEQTAPPSSSPTPPPVPPPFMPTNPQQ